LQEIATDFSHARFWISAVATTVNSLPSYAPPFLPFFISLGISASGARRRLWSTASRFAARKSLPCRAITTNIRKLTEEFSWLSNVAEISIYGQPVVICHYAVRVWNRSHHGAWHLYGHSHGNIPDTPTSLSMDVGVDTHDFHPWHFDEINLLMTEKAKRG
jgi:hypothetical protein